jgi:peptidoglycan/LPS O-acetylase OafA/YrhL
MPAVGPFWSLATEEQFYLLWPAVVRRLRPRQMMRLLLVLALGLEAVRTVAALRGAGRMQYSPLHCDGLAWGAMVALVALRARVPFRVEGGARLWNDLGRWMLLAGAAAMAVALALRMVGANDLGLPVTAAGPLFGGLLLYVLSHPKGVVGLCLSWGPLRMLGAISYMAYLSHPYMMELFDRYIGPRMATHGVDYLWTRLIAAFAATLLWSLLTLYAWERPLGRLRRYFVAAA